jgi:hypothetical protein
VDVIGHQTICQNPNPSIFEILSDAGRYMALSATDKKTVWRSVPPWVMVREPWDDTTGVTRDIVSLRYEFTKT